MRSLLVAGGGGHLEELWLLRSRLVGISSEVTWATPDTPQSRSLLGHEDRISVVDCQPRDVRATLATTRHALKIVRPDRWDQVVSTGSLVAVPFLTVARARGIPCHYIESAARVVGPSLSAQILERVPGVHRYRQSPEWHRDGWSYRGSVFDGFETTRAKSRPLRHVVVTVGTNRYGFRRLVDSVLRALPSHVEVTWQTGATDLSGLGIRAIPTLSARATFEAMQRADVVVCHAGVGSAVTAMRAGKFPILVPRRRAHGEHVDDHQEQIAAMLDRMGLAFWVEPDQLDTEVLVRAAQRAVIRSDEAPPFILHDDGRHSPTPALHLVDGHRPAPSGHSAPERPRSSAAL